MENDEDENEEEDVALMASTEAGMGTLVQSLQSQLKESHTSHARTRYGV